MIDKLTVGRFSAKVNYQPTSTGCIEWTGRSDKRGYGRYDVLGRTYGAHRIAFAIEYGLELDALPPVVMHQCDNPRCVNPLHLRAGTQRDNMLDMLSKRRHWRSDALSCRNGHEYTADSSYLASDGSRRCRICRRDRVAEHRARRSR